MKKPQGYGKLSELADGLGFGDFRILRSIHFFQPDRRVPIHRIELEIETDRQTRNFRLHLIADDVVGFRLDGFGRGEARIIGLDIVDISANQWENQLWELIDFENNSIEFRARSIDVAELLVVAPDGK